MSELSSNQEKKCPNKGNLTKGKCPIPLTSFYYLVCISCFFVENIIYLHFETRYLNEKVNCAKPSTSISCPWFK